MSLWDFHICNRYTEAIMKKTPKTILDPEVIFKTYNPHSL